MTKSVLDPLTQLFRPQAPLWACEFTAKHLIVAGVGSSRKKIAGKGIAPLPPKVLTGSLSEKNIADPQAVLSYLKDVIGQSGFKGHEIGVVIPDDSARIAFVNAESLPSTFEERAAFIRWKLKKTVPFDVDTAQIAFQIVGTSSSGDTKGTDLLVALSPRAVVEEYERLMEALGFEAGLVVSSSVAALNTFTMPDGDVLFLKIAPGCIATTVFQKGRPEFHRKVTEMPLYDAVYPTLMYYQDKLGGAGLNGLVVCGYDSDTQSELRELQEKLGVVVQRLGPAAVDDIYKPALGAVELVWANLI